MGVHVDVRPLEQPVAMPVGFADAQAVADGLESRDIWEGRDLVEKQRPCRPRRTRLQTRRSCRLTPERSGQRVVRRRAGPGSSRGQLDLESEPEIPSDDTANSMGATPSSTGAELLCGIPQPRFQLNQACPRQSTPTAPAKA